MPKPPDDAVTDEVLMSRFQRLLDEQAVNELVGRYLGRARAVARQLLWDRSLADDAVQEAFVRLVRGRDSYDPSRSFSVWFYTILRNVCLDMIRRRRLEVEMMRTRAAEFTPARAADKPDIEGMLASLPPIEREALTLRTMHDLSFAEVAAALGISEEAAKKRAQRGIARLRERMCKNRSG